MSLPAINLLNIGLMLLSLAVAMFVPFETFLLAYAVLGPLHYLTQISWMHERRYFTRVPRDGLWLTLLCVVIAVVALIGMKAGHRPSAQAASTLMAVALGLSMLFALTADKALRWTGVVLIGVIALLLHGATSLEIVVGIYVPTLIHVCLFTAAFVLYGALKSRSWTAHASLLVFVGCVATALLLDPGTLGYHASDFATENYGFFHNVHGRLMADTARLDAPMKSMDELYSHPASLQVARLIAFAYTYHYFNWFSKTSIIRWHEVPKARIAAMVAIWIASVTLYLVDFTSGITWLLFLSYLHVILEFPLDWRTFAGIGQELKARVLPSSAAAAQPSGR